MKDGTRKKIGKNGDFVDYILKKYPTNLLFSIGEQDERKDVYIDTDGIEQDPNSELYFSREELAQSTIEKIETDLGESLDDYLEALDKEQLFDELTGYYDGLLVMDPNLETSEEKWKVGHYFKDDFSEYTVSYSGENAFEIDYLGKPIKRFDDPKNALVDLVDYIESEMDPMNDFVAEDKDFGIQYYEEFLQQTLDSDTYDSCIRLGEIVAEHSKNTRHEFLPMDESYFHCKSFLEGKERWDELIAEEKSFISELSPELLEQFEEAAKEFGKNYYSSLKVETYSVGEFIDLKQDEIIDIISEKLGCSLKTANNIFYSDSVSDDEIVEITISDIQGNYIWRNDNKIVDDPLGMYEDFIKENGSSFEER